MQKATGDLNSLEYQIVNKPNHTTFKGGAKMAELKYEIKKHIGVIGEGTKGWKKEVNLVSWNERKPKLDIRDWDENHEKMGRNNAEQRRSGGTKETPGSVRSRGNGGLTASVFLPVRHGDRMKVLSPSLFKNCPQCYNLR